MTEGEKIIQINIEDEMRSAYIDYSMSVIVSRALPDVRDGLKPVHRRVLFGMYELGVTSSRAYKKSARIVGEVLGKYHPHGDTSVYDSMVRMAQHWSLRYMLVDGQGNFGSVDGDSPAAMRYTEARLRKISEEMLSDIEKNTVDTQLNFDDTLKEPKVLPTRVPGLLVNGASGIAVGMATNMPPHNLTEVCNAIVGLIDDPSLDIDSLMAFVKAPDFPTGGLIYGYEGVKDAFHTGKGRVVLRAKARVEEIKDREYIIVDEIPYMVNKAEMIKKTADLVNDGKIEGIADLNDESDRKGMRIVYKLKRDAIPHVVLNQLYKYTQLQSSFSVNNIALVKGRPMLLNLKQMLECFIEHRHDVVVRRTQYELEQAEKRAHILEGLLIALDNLDEVIKLIRASKSPEIARNGLIERFALTEIQARAILDLRLQKLTGLESDKIREEHQELMVLIDDLKDILNNESRRMGIIKAETIEIIEKYGDDRRTEINYVGGEFSMEDMIPNEEVVVTTSHAGYIKRTPLIEYKSQHRGGVGQKAASTRDKDFIEDVFTAKNHDYMLFLTEQGRCFWLRVFEIPEGSRTAKGRAIQNLISIPKDDKVMAYLNTGNLKDEDYINSHYLVMATKKGLVKKTLLEAYSRPRVNGINAIVINEGDQLLEAKLTSGEHEIMLALNTGKAIRFNETKVRSVGRTSKGVRGMTLGEGEHIVGMVCVEDPLTSVLVVSEKGYGKRSLVEDYRVTNRGGKGVKTITINEKTGSLIAIKNVKDTDDMMIINKSGLMIRMGMEDIRVMGRAASGVRLISLRKNDEIAAVAKIEKDENAEELETEATENSEFLTEDNQNETLDNDTNNDVNNDTNTENNED
ncbi:MAG: DNA gyrase subunit A [Flavobacteriales bacterium]